MDNVKGDSNSADDHPSEGGAEGGTASEASLDGAAAAAAAAASLSASFAADPLAAVAAGEAFAVVPLEWCPHLEFPDALNPVPGGQIDVRKVIMATVRLLRIESVLGSL